MSIAQKHCIHGKVQKSMLFTEIGIGVGSYLLTA